MDNFDIHIYLENFNRISTQEQIDDIDEKFGNFFYRTGISFRVAESSAFKDFVKALNPTYAKVLPSRKHLSGAFLEKAHKKSSNRIEEILAGADNLTLISDGWTNVKGDHIVNFCIKAPGKKTIFYSSIDTTGISQDSEAIADAICSVIEKLGPQHFCCVITDNANVMKKSWEIIETTYPHISANGCAAHVMNLLIKDILGLYDNTETQKNAEKIIKYVSNHHLVRGKFEARRKIAKVPHTLTMPVVTRWYSTYTSMRDLLSSKYVLIKLVDDEMDMLKEIKPKAVSLAVTDLIKSSEFWDQLSELVKTIEYPVQIIGEYKHFYKIHFCKAF